MAGPLAPSQVKKEKREINFIRQNLSFFNSFILYNVQQLYLEMTPTLNQYIIICTDISDTSEALTLFRQKNDWNQ